MILVQTIITVFAMAMAGFTFHEGDQANYKMNIASFINGTMSMTVTAVTADSVTMEQKVDMMGQAQSCISIMNPNTGEIKSITCNGQAQNPPAAGDIEVIETKEDTVTVPAGTFQTLYVKAKQKSQNQEIEQWINPKLIPVGGMVKMNTGTQLGPMTAELTSFKKN